MSKTEFYNVTAVGVSDRALLVEIEGLEYWVPKSVIDEPESGMPWDYNEPGTLVVDSWWVPHMEPCGNSARSSQPEWATIRLTPEQHTVVMAAMTKVRRMLKVHDISEGRCLELICADFIGG